MSLQLVRTKNNYTGTSTTFTTTFDEPTALDSSHLLVAVAWVGTSTAATVSGWTAVTGSGANGAVQLRMWVKQGDGSTNSITINKSNVASGIILMAFSGFSTTTPLLSAGQSTSSNTTATITPASTPTGYGVAIAVHATPSASGPVLAWTNGYTVYDSEPSAAGFSVSLKEYDSASGSYGTTVTWTSAFISRQMFAFIPLVPTPITDVSYALGADPRTLALGAAPVTGVVGTEP